MGITKGGMFKCFLVPVPGMWWFYAESDSTLMTFGLQVECCTSIKPAKKDDL